MRRPLPVALAWEEWSEVIALLEGAAQETRDLPGAEPEDEERALEELRVRVFRQVVQRLRRARKSRTPRPLFAEGQFHENTCGRCGKTLWREEDGEVLDAVVRLDIEYSGRPSPDALGAWCSQGCFVSDLKERLRARR